MRKFPKFVVAGVVATCLSLPVVTFAQPQDRDDHPQARREGREEHPVIRNSIRKLKEVRNELANRAAHDFGGHRVEAIRSIDQAIEHLNQALAYDKK